MYWYFHVFKNYFNFKGRAARKEFWTFKLIHWLIVFILLSPFVCFILAFLGIEININFDFAIFVCCLFLYFVLTFFPNLTVTIRRLHDTGRSGTYIFLVLIPIIGVIVQLIILLQQSIPFDNQYGRFPGKKN